MPIYEYRCGDCRTKTTVVTLSVGAAVDPVCRHCGGRRMEKLVSRVAVRRSEESRLDGLADPSALAGLDESDPKSVARWMKRMGRELGEEAGEGLDGEVDQALDEAEREKEGGAAGGSMGELWARPRRQSAQVVSAPQALHPRSVPRAPPAPSPVAGGTAGAYDSDRVRPVTGTASARRRRPSRG